MHLKLTIAYDGTPFCGWQIQPKLDTIQAQIESALTEIAKEPIRIHGAGRTDAGVHALGQVAHFTAPHHLNMNPFNWVPALNTKLPASIRITACAEVPADFHARYSATAKTYTYHLSLAPILPPFLASRAWHLPRQLNPDDLQLALSQYLGSHDFRSFCSNRGNETAETDYTRHLTRAELQHIPEGYLLTFTGNGFLYKMVRFLTGAAVQTAQGYLHQDELSLLLNDPHARIKKSLLCAPPDGLSLLSVHYGTPTSPKSHS